MQPSRLPKRVPVGTKYVVEGKNRGDGQVHIFSRYLVFPDGRCFDLPADIQEFAPHRRSFAHRRDRDSAGVKKH